MSPFVIGLVIILACSAADGNVIPKVDDEESTAVPSDSDVTENSAVDVIPVTKEQTTLQVTEIVTTTAEQTTEEMAETTVKPTVKPTAEPQLLRSISDESKSIIVETEKLTASASVKAELPPVTPIKTPNSTGVLTFSFSVIVTFLLSVVITFC